MEELVKEEPVTMAIVAAIAARATAGQASRPRRQIDDAYAALKRLLVRKFGAESKAVKAVRGLEEEPDSAGWAAMVREELINANANADRDLVAAAGAVFAKVMQLTSGEQKDIQLAMDNFIAPVDRRSTAKASPKAPRPSLDRAVHQLAEQDRRLRQIAEDVLAEEIPERVLSQLQKVPNSRQADDAEYVVWYGTNRRPIDPHDSGKGYSGKRDTTVHYGLCRVFVPKSHKIGSIGSPWWKRLLVMKDDRLQLLAVREVAPSVYWRTIAAHLARVAADARSALIFVHGYNVSFEAAALRAAQIGFDLSIKGAMAFFSWPSRGKLDAYSADEATIEASEGMITDFMVDFATLSGAKAVHVIAHSMGNRAVLRAVNRIAAQAKRRSGKLFGQFVLAAADVDADTFCQLSAAYGRVARRATLYVSARDLAVEASRWLHQFPRAGLMPPVLVAPGIDTIIVTNVDMTMLGHGYIAEARDVLRDVHELIVHGAPPERRFGLREVRSQQGERHWLIAG